MENLHLKYGKSLVELAVADNTTRLRFQEPAHDVDQGRFMAELEELLATREPPGQVAVVVADKTRLCGYSRILPWVVELLERRGGASVSITFYIAYGTHPPQSEQECLDAYGEVYGQYQFIHHDCQDRDSLMVLGRTSSGTEVVVRREIVESDMVLTIGAISHHYFAGYGGARKLLFPGLAGREAIYANHRLFLDQENMHLARGCRPGNLESNPLAEDLREIHEMLPEYLSIHAILDSAGQPARYSFGSSYDDFLKVCAELDDCYKLRTEKRYDLVVASAGGYPKDINIIQSHKAIHNAAPLVREGGDLIVLAECADGVGSTTFLPYFELGGWEKTFAHLVREYAGNGGTALAMMEKTARINISMVTSLSPEICQTIGVRKITLEQMQEMTRNHSGNMALIENGSVLVAELGCS